MAGIWLVRHAATAWTGVRWCGRSDPPLTAEGHSAATLLGRRLRASLGSTPTIMSSPACRAVATAEAIAAAWASAPDVRIHTDRDLAEVDFGEVDGLTFEDIDASWPTLAARLLAADLDVDWPCGEAADDVRARVMQAWDRLVQMADDSNVVAVTHGRLIAALLAEIVGHGQPVSFHSPPATAIHLECVDRSWRIRGEVTPAIPTVGRLVAAKRCG